MIITHTQLENYLDRRQTRFTHSLVELSPELESAVKLGLLIGIVTDALNSEAGWQTLRDQVATQRVMKTKRWCYWINETQDPNEHGGYVPSVVTENEPGHQPLLGSGEGAAPWVWGKTLAEAKATCKAANEKRGFSDEDCWNIVASSMSA